MTTDLGDLLLESLSWEHERLVCISKPEIGLEAVTAIHSTVLGPALGGLRMRRYGGGLAEAFDDALRLSRAMTLKAAAAGLDLGGGKAVIVDDGRADLREARLSAVAQEIEQLGGAYITAEDIGTTTEDMEIISRHTDHVVGRSSGQGVRGDPSPDTARGVLGAMRTAVEVLDGTTSLQGRRVGILGLGKVGRTLARGLLGAGADVIAYEPVPEAAARMKSDVDLVESPQSVLTAALDVLSPCAVGGTITPQTAGEVRCQVICGAANNQLVGKRSAEILAERQILYVPDFLANCGGLIHVDAERRSADPSIIEHGLIDAQIRTRAVLTEALAMRRLPSEIAEEHALRRLRDARSGQAAE